MKKFVLTIVTLVLAASPAFAQFGDISAYTDQAGTDCNISDTASGIKDVFVLLKHTSGATAAKLRVEQGSGGTMFYSNDIIPPPFLSIGNSQTDLEVAFTSCLVGDFHFLTVRYFAQGTSAPCSYINVLDAPGSPNPGEVIIVDCTAPFGVVRNVARGQAIINPNGSCNCNVSVTETTWGAIKALYQ